MRKYYTNKSELIRKILWGGLIGIGLVGVLLGILGNTEPKAPDVQTTTPPSEVIAEEPIKTKPSDTETEAFNEAFNEAFDEAYKNAGNDASFEEAYDSAFENAREKVSTTRQEENK